MTKAAGYYDLRQAFGEPGCALCRLLARIADGYIDGMLWELVNEATFITLVEAQKAVWQRLSADLAEFIRKKDHRFQHEDFGSEGDAWLRAIEAVVGAPPVRAK